MHAHAYVGFNFFLCSMQYNGACVEIVRISDTTKFDDPGRFTNQVLTMAEDFHSYAFQAPAVPEASVKAAEVGK